MSRGKASSKKIEVSTGSEGTKPLQNNIQDSFQASFEGNDNTKEQDD